MQVKEIIKSRTLVNGLRELRETEIGDSKKICEIVKQYRKALNKEENYTLDYVASTLITLNDVFDLYSEKSKAEMAKK